MDARRTNQDLEFYYYYYYYYYYNSFQQLDFVLDLKRELTVVYIAVSSNVQCSVETNCSQLLVATGSGPLL